MPFFRYSGTDQSGSPTSGTVEAASADDAMMQLVKSGLNISQLMKTLSASVPTTPVAREPVKVALTTPVPPQPVAPKQVVAKPIPATPAAPKGPIIHTKEASDKDRMFLFSQLSKQLKAGMGLAEALTDLRPRVSKKITPSLEEAAKAATNGKPISDTFEQYPDLYPEYVVGMIRAGEQGGFMEEACGILSDQAQSAHLFGRSFWWVRPLIINALIAMPLAILFLQSIVEAWKIVEPKGEEATMADAIAGMTQSVLHGLVWPYGPITLILYALSYFSYKALRAPKARQRRHEIVLRWPVFGARTKHECLAVFSWTMAKLAKGGTSPKRSWELAADTVPNLAVRDKMLRVGQALSGSERLSDALFKEGFFPEEYGPIIATAELTGDMPGAFEQLAKISQGEFDAAQDAAKFKSKGWGRAGCWAVGGLILILTCWAMYYELLPAILKGLE